MKSAGFLPLLLFVASSLAGAVTQEGGGREFISAEVMINAMHEVLVRD